MIDCWSRLPQGSPCNNKVINQKDSFSTNNPKKAQMTKEFSLTTLGLKKGGKKLFNSGSNVWLNELQNHCAHRIKRLQVGRALHFKFPPGLFIIFFPMHSLDKCVVEHFIETAIKKEKCMTFIIIFSNNICNYTQNTLINFDNSNVFVSPSGVGLDKEKCCKT